MRATAIDGKLEDAIEDVGRALRAAEQGDKTYAKALRCKNLPLSARPGRDPPARGWPNASQFKVWLNRYSPNEIDYAIRAVGPRFRSGRLQGTLPAVIRYVSGVLKSERQERGPGGDAGVG